MSSVVKISSSKQKARTERAFVLRSSIYFGFEPEVLDCPEVPLVVSVVVVVVDSLFLCFLVFFFLPEVSLVCPLVSLEVPV